MLLNPHLDYLNVILYICVYSDMKSIYMMDQMNIVWIPLNRETRSQHMVVVIYEIKVGWKRVFLKVWCKSENVYTYFWEM